MQVCYSRGATEQKKSSLENTSHTERLYRNLGIKQEGNDRKDRMGEEITKDLCEKPITAVCTLNTVQFK